MIFSSDDNPFVHRSRNRPTCTLCSSVRSNENCLTFLGLVVVTECD